MTVANRPYYTLLTEDYDGQWCITFGDYDQGVVVQEQVDCMEADNLRSKQCRIIKTPGDSQEVIEAEVAALNANRSKT